MASSDAARDPRLLLIAPADNCLVVCRPLAEGEVVQIEGVARRMAHAVEIGHKLARRDIRRGDKVLRYGAVIGTASRDIAAGEHIHLHNLASDYLPPGGTATAP
ncbi:MAG: UxaA family hydrolase [Burkholderiales bacterium]|nr:UxaA family hydrolase [Burkholderiales bacterium]MDE2454866.1 UxaA family hydrolase [Burkholderiales bacterium]